MGIIKSNYIYRDACIRSFDRIRKEATGTLIFYRPHRRSLTEALQELEIFTSVDEMFDFIIEHLPFDNVFDKSDLSIGEDIGPDERIGWSETRYILTKRCCGKIYDTPQCIGMCSFEKIKEDNVIRTYEGSEKMIKRFVVAGTSLEVPNNQIRMCGFFESEFKTGDVVYVTREPFTRAPIKLTVNNDIHIDEEALKKYGCIVSPHVSFELWLEDGFDVISIISEDELKELNY